MLISSAVTVLEINVKKYELILNQIIFFKHIIYFKLLYTNLK